MNFARTTLLAAIILLAAGCGDDGGAIDPDIDAPPPTPDAGVDAPIDAPLGAPVVAITSHTDGQRITGGRTITIAGTLADPDSTISSVTVTVGAAAPVVATFDQTSFSASITLADNDNVITVTATDDTARGGADQTTLTFPFVALTSFPSASMVLGQSSFITAASRAADAGRVGAPYGRPTEIAGAIYVADYAGDRILGFRGFPSQDGASADFVLGQPSMTSAMTGASATLMSGPQGVLGHGGRMYAVDYDNHRILIWNTPPTTTNAAADAVLGQTAMTANTPACTATGLRNPEEMIVAGNKLIVADAGNNRVLVWNTVPAAGGVAPDLVLGQADFTHCVDDDDNQDGTADATSSLRTLDYPSSVWSDGTRLFVADVDNNRVMVWNTFPTTSFQPADFVLGQPDAASSTTGTAADRFGRPYGLTSNGNQLFVAERGNHRVKIWNQLPASNVAADLVLGQSDFTHVAYNDDNQDGTADATPSARTLRGTAAVWLVRDRLFVSDTSNNRVLMFGTPVCMLNAGLYEYPAGSGTCVDDPCQPSTCTNYRTCSRDTGVAVCSCPAGITGDCDTCVRHVDPAATGAGTGYSWADAMTSIPPALTSAASAGFACDVWVKEGTYYAYASGDANSFTLTGDVRLRGGFAGTETTAAARSGGATILDGRDSAAGANDVYHVVSSTSVLGTPTLDRLTIRYGNANGTGTNASGGGVYIASGARLTVNDCVIESNRANTNGGGLVNNGGTGASTTLSSSTFRNNYAGVSGGGAHLSSGTVTGCTFDRNSVGTTFGQGGGGVTLLGGGTLTSSVLSNNSVAGDGGGIWVRNATSAWTISGCQVLSNRATNAGGIYFDAAGAGSTMGSSLIAGNVASPGGGGGMFMRDSGPTLTNLTVVGNIAAQGGGIATSGFSGTITNAIAWGNVSPDGSDVRFNTFSGTATYSNFGGGVVTGAGNISVDPLFTHAPIAWDRVVTQVALDSIDVSTGARFAVGDTIELANDGVARQITAVTGNNLTFTPALTASPADTTVQNWATESVNLAADFHLATGSPCIDTGTPAGTDMGAYP